MAWYRVGMFFISSSVFLLGNCYSMDSSTEAVFFVLFFPLLFFFFFFWECIYTLHFLLSCAVCIISYIK